MRWYQKVLIKHKNEIILSAASSLLVSFIFLLWKYKNGVGYVWTDFYPIEAPSIVNRLFYSALTYVGIGRALYYSTFYFLLYRFIGDWKLYNQTKKMIWFILTLGTFVAFEKLVNYLNTAISILFNLLIMLFYYSPLIICLLLFIVLVWFYKNQRIVNK